MKEFTLVLDCFNIKELDEYLKTIDGIKEILIDDDYLVSINIKYDDKLINSNRIRLETLAFLNLLNYPCIYGFNKHLENSKVYKIVRNSICCDFCYYNIIEELYNIDGITGVESNFYKKFWKKELVNEKYYIDIFYDSKKLTLKKMEKIEKELDIAE